MDWCNFKFMVSANEPVNWLLKSVLLAFFEAPEIKSQFYSFNLFQIATEANLKREKNSIETPLIEEPNMTSWK